MDQRENMSVLEDNVAQLARQVARLQEKQEQQHMELSACKVQIQDQQQRYEASSSGASRRSSGKSSTNAKPTWSPAANTPSICETPQPRDATVTPSNSRQHGSLEIIHSQENLAYDDESPSCIYSATPSPASATKYSIKVVVKDDQRRHTSSTGTSDTLTRPSSEHNYDSNAVINPRKRKYVSDATSIKSSPASNTHEENHIAVTVPVTTETTQRRVHDQSKTHVPMSTQLAELRRENTRLQISLDDAQKSLNDAHSRLIDMQPVEMGITESSAASAFRALIGDVRAWINDNLCEYLVSSQAKPRIPSFSRSRHRLQSREDLFALMPYTNKINSQDRALENHHLLAIIMSFLMTNIFDPPLFGVLAESDEKLILGLYSQMTSPGSKRTKANCRSWWNETMQAAIKQKDFTAQRRDRKDMLANSLASILGVMTAEKDINMPAFIMSISRAMIEPAISIACQLALSEFYVDAYWTELSGGPRGRQKLPQEAYSDWEFIDVDAHGKIVKPMVGDEDKDYLYIAEASPGLWCTRTDGSEKYIVKPQVLVQQGCEPVSSGDDDSAELSIFALLQAKMPPTERSTRGQ